MRLGGPATAGDEPKEVLVMRLFRFRSLPVLLALMAFPVVAQADGLYLKLAAQDSKVRADQPVRVKLTAVATRSFALPAAPQFLIDDGSGMKVRPDLQAKAVESSGGTLVTPDATVNGSWELLLPQPGRYKVRARYQLGDRVVESNKVSIEVLATP